MTSPPGRSWGYWTRVKLGMLSDYLRGFATASKGQPERVYLDAFAGEGAGLDRLTGEEFPGSARIALEAGDRAGFTRFRFFELGRRAGDLESRLRRDYPDRDIEVYEGDCNETIPAALAELRRLNWAPTFAFLDPDGMELAWDTIVALADHKRGYRAPTSHKPEYKTEQWCSFRRVGSSEPSRWKRGRSQRRTGRRPRASSGRTAGGPSTSSACRTGLPGLRRGRST